MGYTNRHKYKGRKRYLPALLAVLSAAIIVNLLGAVSYDISALQIRAEANLDTRGRTRIVLPPVGEIFANTHASPVELSVTLQNIDLDRMRALIFTDEADLPERLMTNIQQEANRVLKLFVLKLVALGGVGGLIGVYISGIRHPSTMLMGFVIGCLVIGSLAGFTILTYDVNAFDNPQYRGIVEAAPWMINLVRESLVRVDEFGEQLRLITTNLYAAFQRIEELRMVGLIEAELVVLHVSDIHNNPVAYDFARQIVESFAVDFVIDTGDLTDWGTPLEAEIVSRIEQLNIPYVFITGNHDAPDILVRLGLTENAIVINNGEQEVMGLRLAGMGDAAADSYSPQSAPIAELQDTANRIVEKYQGVEDPPDIFLVHNHRIASAIPPGIFPVILFGHNHIPSLSQQGETVYINAGTTGAAGIRGLQSREPIPFTLSLLYFHWNDQQHRFTLTAVDSVRVEGLQASVSLNRTFIDRSRNQLDGVELFDEVLEY